MRQIRSRSRETLHKILTNLGNTGLLAGIATALTTGAHTVVEFNDGTNTYEFDHADSSFTLTAKDAIVELTGAVYNHSTLTSADHVA